MVAARLGFMRKRVSHERGVVVLFVGVCERERESLLDTFARPSDPISIFKN